MVSKRSVERRMCSVMRSQVHRRWADTKLDLIATMIFYFVYSKCLCLEGKFVAESPKTTREAFNIKPEKGTLYLLCNISFCYCIVVCSA